MAILTTLSAAEVANATRAFGVTTVSSSGVLAGSVNTNFQIVDARGGRWFLRLYEEQDHAGAAREAALLTRIAAAGVRTPAPEARRDGAGYVETVRDKPALLFPFALGSHRCQALVSKDDARAVGVAVARVHRVGESLVGQATSSAARPAGVAPTRLGSPEANAGEKSFAASEALTTQSRFSIDALRSRLTSVSGETLPAELKRDRDMLAERVEDLAAWTATALPLPLIHGDLFRDNVLFDEGGATLLDFESASTGGAAYDLAVTVLAWCFGDTLEASLVRALISGYQTERALAPAEIADLPHSAALACVRFATTRITDYELRPRGVGVYKDYRRWVARLARIDASFGLRGGILDSTLRDIWPT